MQDFSDFEQQSRPSSSPAPQRGTPVWVWLLFGVGGIAVLGCGGLFTVIAFVGVYAPDTAVYTGNEVPARFVKTMKSVGALDEDENILYFYADGFDIKEGFYFVSDKKVVIYSEATGNEPLLKIGFDEIAELELAREESFFIDSEITLELKNGLPVSFPVSSEGNKDERFFEAIESGIAKAAGADGPPADPEETLIP